MKKYFIGGLLPFLILFGLSYGLIKAADVEIILGTSSAFNVVRGTSTSSGTKMVYVGSATVSIGTTTQSAMLTVVGSSTDTTGGLQVTNSSGTVTLNVRNDGAVFIVTNTSTLSSALYVGSATSGSLGTITAGFLSMGTISANTSLHGTTTVRFLADIFANGTITASKFSGGGAGLTGVTATTFSGGGTISAGSTTVSTLTSTGSTTVTGTLTAGGGNFVIDNNANRAVIDFNTVGIGTNTPSSSYMLQVTDSSDLGVAVGSSGSITAKTITATGSATVTGTLTAGGGNFVVDNSVSRAVIDFNTVGIGTNTPSSNYMLQVTDSSDPGVVVGSSGTITAKTLTITGSATVTGTLTAAIGAGSSVGIGTTTPSASYRLQVTDDANLGFVVGNNGSITAKAITATGSATITGPVLIGTNTPSLLSALYVGSSTTGNLGTITAGFLSTGTISANVGLHGTTTVHFTGNVRVSGEFSAATKQFLIPHPDPEKKGWLLRHSAVESPTRGDNLYR